MTATYYSQRLREIIALQTTGEAFSGEIEMESTGTWRQSSREGHPRCGIGNADADYREKVLPTALSIPTAGRATTRRMCPDQALKHQSFGIVRRPGESHQRDREFLEPGRALLAQIQRYSQGAFSAVLEGMRLTIQQPVATSQINTVKTMG